MNAHRAHAAAIAVPGFSPRFSPTRGRSLTPVWVVWRRFQLFLAAYMLPVHCLSPMHRSFGVVLALALGSCDRKPPPPAPSPPAAVPIAESAAPAPSETPEPADASVARGPFNTVLIVIDSLRYDVEWNGVRRIKTPRLTAFSKNSVVYRNAYAISSTTARSIAPLLAGRYPSEMVRNGYYFTQWYPDNVFVS